MKTEFDKTWTTSNGYFNQNHRSNSTQYAVVFYIAFALFLASSLLSETNFEQFFLIDANVVRSLLSLWASIYLALYLVLSNIRVSRLVISLLIILFSLIIWFTSGESDYVWLSLFFVSSVSIDEKSIYKITVCVYSCVLLVTMICSFAGVIDSQVMLSERLAQSRYSFGFTHPNQFARVLTVICLSLMALYFEEGLSKKIAIAACVLLLLLFESFTVGSRTTEIILIIGLSIFMLCENERFRIGINTFAPLLAVIIILISLTFMVAFNPSNGFIDKLDAFLSHRLGFMHQYFKVCGLDLLGREDFRAAGVGMMSLKGTYNTFVVDNAFAHLILREGIIAFGMFIVLIVISMVIESRRRVFSSIQFGLLLFCLIGFVETYQYKVDCNIFLICVGPLIWDSINNCLSERHWTRR